jgi:hypothetical protein
MVPLFALLLASASATTVDTAPVTALASPGDSARVLLTASRGTASDGLRGVVDAELATLLPRIQGLEFITAGDLGRRMSLEGEKQRYDCGSDLTACMAELRSALGVPWAVFVDVDALGDTATIAMTLLGEDGAARGRELVRTPADGRSMGTDLRPALARLILPVQQAAGIVVIVDQAPSLLFMGGAAAVGAGLVAAGIGAVPALVFAQASSQTAALRDDAELEGALARARDHQQAQQQAAADWDQWGQPAFIVGAVLVGVGATALGLSALENP